MLKKITTIALAMMTGFVEPVQIFAEEQTQATPVPTEEASSDLEGGISQGYPTPAPEEDTTATDETTDVSPDTTPDANDENADENVGENAEEPTEGDESKAKASFKEGVEQQEDGTFVWNVDTEEKEHTFAYRVELSKLDQAQVKVLVPSTVFRDGEEGYFIASDLEADNSKLHLKVYEIQTSEDGTETKLEVKNEPQKEAPTDGVNAIAEANGVLQDPTLEPGQGTLFPDTSVSEDEEGSEDTDEGEKTEVKYSTNYVSQLAEESGVLEIKACAEAPLETSVIQVEYTVEKGIYGNVCPQVFTAIADIGDENSDEFVECESNELEFVKNDGGKELKKNDNVGTVKDKATDNSATTYTVTYDAGDGQFDGGSKTNVVKYNVISNPMTKYSHTSNLSDDGTKKSNYGNNEKKTEVVTIPGATQLTVTVTYGGESKSYDWLSIFSGNHPGYTAANDYSKADIVQKLGGGTHTDSSNTVTYTVQGDSVTFTWKTDSSGCGEGYGYYAKIVWSGRTMSGAYKWPTPPTKKKLDGWATTKGGTVVYPNTGVSNDKVTSNITLYAVYSDFHWYDDWEYTLNNTDHTILLKEYNGEETTYTIPSSAKIDGNTYKTAIGEWSSGYPYIAQLNTGTITNLSIQTGVKIYNNLLRKLFYGMKNLKSIDFSNLDTSNVTDTYCMFYDCSSLTALDISNFNTSKVTNMNSMFSGCSKLTSLNVSNFNTSKVTDMNGMFFNCSNLTALDVSNFDTSKVTDMSNMFTDCSNLTALDISHFNTNKVTRMGSMFYRCSNLTVLDVSNFNTSNVITMNGMFYGCSNLTTLDLSNFDTSNVTGMGMSLMFYRCSNLTALDVSNFDTSKVTDMSNMFTDCSNLTALDVSRFDTSKVTNMSYMFWGCSSLKALDVSGFSTSNVTKMYIMFSGCSNLTALDVSRFDTSKVTNMNYMFSGCSSLKTLDVSNFNTSKVTNMKGMFYSCLSLTELEIGSSIKFLYDSGINDAASERYTGKWRLNNTGTAINLITQYDGSKPGTYYRELQKYSITYDLAGGSISGQKTSYNVETADFTLPTPSKTGHTFTGWTGSNGSTAQTTVKIAKGSTGNKSYTANWRANTYTYNIKYVSKSGVALGTATVSGTYGFSKNVTAPAKTGYSTPVAQNVAFDSVNAKTITFTYTPVDYAITYNLAGGSISGQKTSYNTETANFTLPTPTRSGYTFNGWTGTGLSSAAKTVTVAKGSTGTRSYTATWSPANYTITYNLDGGSVSGQKTSYNIETADFTLPTPSKTGHTFTGWTGTGLSSTTQTVTVTKGSTGNRSYTANWSINKYDIILKGDAGTESVTYGGKTYPLDATHSVTIRAIYNTNTAVTYKVKPKYHIVSETGTSMSNTDSSWSNNIGKEGSTGGQTWTTCAFTRTITIKTASNQFTVTFNANTGTGTMNNQIVTNNASQKVNVNAFKKAGYTFKNWNTRADGTGTTYANSATVDSIATSNGATVTLYAQWTKDTYTISYNLNGGSVTGNPTSYQVDTADITLKNPSKTGYSFAGWTGSNGSTAQTTVKIAKGSTGNKSYTANWAANTYTYNIKYVSKSGVSLGTATVSGTYGSSKNVTAPAKTGYSTPVAQNVAFDSVSVKTITFTYTPIDYTITYDVNGGNSLSGQRTTYNVESSAYTLPTPSRAGHTFTGWTGSNGTTAQTSVVLTKGTTGNKSYKANWKAKTYTITYNSNCTTSSGTMATDTVTYGTSFTAKANGFTRPGYKFAGWTENADGTGSNWTNWIGKPWTWTYTRSITLYAQWAKETYTISYSLNGGSISGQKTSYDIETADFTLPTPAKAGHTFAGWTWSGNTTPQKSVTIKKGTTGNKSYTANWTTNSCTLTYNANGGTVTPASNSIKYGDPYILPTPSRVGYKFNGWFTSATGGTQVTTSNKMSGNTTVYAQWTANKLTVNYYPNGATKKDDSVSQDGSDIVEITSDKCFYTDALYYGDTFRSWGLYNATRLIREGYTSNNLYHAGNPDSKVMLNAGDNVYAKTQDLAKAAGVLPQLEKGDTTLNIYAHWEPNTYTNQIDHWAYGFKNGDGNNNDKRAYHLKHTTFTKKYGEKVTYTTNDAITIPNGFSLRENFGSSAYEGSWKYYKMGTSFSQPSKATTVEYDYDPITYTITYSLNGGTLSKANPSTYNVLYGVDFADEPTKDGYKFLGWYINGKKVTGINVGCNATFTSADDLYTKLATRTTGNQTVEAKWEKLKDLTITNKVSGNMGSKDKDFPFTTQFPSSFANATLKVQKNDGSITTITVDANGRCTFTLKHGESFTFKELTEAQYNAIKDLSSYGISESDYSKEGYKTSFKLSTDVEGNLEIAYVNQNGSVLPTGIEAWGTGAVIALIGALMLVVYFLVHRH